MFLIIPFISKPILTIQEQPNIQIAHCLAQPLAQGWRVSLRRDVLAQASPSSPRRGLKKGAGAHAGSHLGETPLAWARYSLAQKSSWSPGRPFTQKWSRRVPVHLA